MDDPAPNYIWVKLLLLAVLIFINAFFAMSEIAVISLNDNKIERMAEEGNKKAKKIRKLTANSSNFLSTIQIGVTLAGFLTSASASESFAGLLAKAVIKPTMSQSLQNFISGGSVVVITIVMSYFSLVLGELVPKRIAMQKPEKVSFRVVGILCAVASVLKPVVKVLSLSTNGVVRLLGMDPNANTETVTEEEIRMMVDVGGEHGVIEDAQKEMIDNIFEFDDIDVGDIMTHRTDMIAVEAEEPAQELVRLAIEEGYSRIPVFDEDPDNIIGIVYIKDLLKYIGNNQLEGKPLRELMRDAHYVPESKRCGELFQEMTENHIQIAVVVDEYGGTAGLVTLEDLIESIVGNIQDEYDNEEEEIDQINDTTFTVDGTTNIDEVDEMVGADLPEGDYETVAGFVISRLGYLPKEGEQPEVTYENLKFTVMAVEDRRIARIRVEILPVEETDEEE